MRYKPEHKAQSREKILDQAARLFRQNGYKGVSIDNLMAASKLTRGGFYGHFSSKSELFAEVVRTRHDFVRRMEARDGEVPAELIQQAAEVARGYLDPENREQVGQGCSLASLSAEVTRAEQDDARQAYTNAVKQLAAEFSRGLANEQPLDPRALASIALCIGGLTLARAVDDQTIADAISKACSNAVAQQLGVE